jgi:hypothetical protein
MTRKKPQTKALMSSYFFVVFRPDFLTVISKMEPDSVAPELSDVTIPRLAAGETEADLVSQDHCTLFQRYQFHSEASCPSQQRIKWRNAVPERLNLKFNIESMKPPATVFNAEVYVRLYSTLKDKFVSNDFVFAIDSQQPSALPSTNPMFVELAKEDLRDLAVAVHVYRLGPLNVEESKAKASTKAPAAAPKAGAPKADAKSAKVDEVYKRPWMSGATLLPIDTIVSVLEGVPEQLSTSKICVNFVAASANESDFSKNTAQVVGGVGEKLPQANLILGLVVVPNSVRTSDDIANLTLVPPIPFANLRPGESRSFLAITIGSGVFAKSSGLTATARNICVDMELRADGGRVLAEKAFKRGFGTGPAVDTYRSACLQKVTEPVWQERICFELDGKWAAKGDNLHLYFKTYNVTATANEQLHFAFLPLGGSAGEKKFLIDDAEVVLPLYKWNAKEAKKMEGYLQWDEKELAANKAAGETLTVATRLVSDRVVPLNKAPVQSLLDWLDASNPSLLTKDIQTVLKTPRGEWGPILNVLPRLLTALFDIMAEFQGAQKPAAITLVLSLACKCAVTQHRDPVVSGTNFRNPLAKLNLHAKSHACAGDLGFHFKGASDFFDCGGLMDAWADRSFTKLYLPTLNGFVEKVMTTLDWAVSEEAATLTPATCGGHPQYGELVTVCGGYVFVLRLLLSARRAQGDNSADSMFIQAFTTILGKVCVLLATESAALAYLASEVRPLLLESLIDLLPLMRADPVLAQIVIQVAPVMLGGFAGCDDSRAGAALQLARLRTCKAQPQ